MDEEGRRHQWFARAWTSQFLVVPLTLKEANSFVVQHHRHLAAKKGARFSRLPRGSAFSTSPRNAGCERSISVVSMSFGQRSSGRRSPRWSRSENSRSSL
jgi:hypothetical protein